jgi:hypothetical protein
MPLRETLIIVIVILGWSSGVFIHRRKHQPIKELIKLPRVISLLFGSNEIEGYVNTKSFFLQILFLAFGINWSLYNFSVITLQKAIFYFVIASGILAAMSISVSIYRNHKAK